jgi:hypothetical protein
MVFVFSLFTTILLFSSSLVANHYSVYFPHPVSYIHILCRVISIQSISVSFKCKANRSCTHVKTHKLLQVCKQVVTNLFTCCGQVVFALLVPSCCNKFGTSCYQHVTSLMALSDLLQGCSNKSDTIMI